VPDLQVSISRDALIIVISLLLLAGNAYLERDHLLNGSDRSFRSTCHFDYRLPPVISAAKKMLEGVGSIRSECHDNHPVSHRALTPTKI